MKQKLVKSSYGVWKNVYEVDHEGVTMWFDEKELEVAARRFATRVGQEDDSDEEPSVIMRD